MKGKPSRKKKKKDEKEVIWTYLCIGEKSLEKEKERETDRERETETDRDRERLSTDILRLGTMQVPSTKMRWVSCLM